MDKKAVLLLNLGSPDSPSVTDVRSYLKEFLMDGRVLDAPYPIRWIIVNGLILPSRPKESAEAYEQIWTEEGAPLITYSEKVRDQLREDFDFPIEIAMRYQNPSTAKVIAQFKEQEIEQLFIIPMYPHYAMSSYESAVVQVYEELKKQNASIKTTLMQPYYGDEDYIQALTASAEPYLSNDDFDLLLFSFHGIPVRHLQKSDPSHAHCTKTRDCCNVPNPAHSTCYRHQCLVTVKHFVERLNIPEEKYTVSFQSRLGRDPWLEPFTDQELERLAREGIRRIKVICPAFVADCLETLEEISIRGKEAFLGAGGDTFEQIPCLNEHPSWIHMLKNRVQLWMKDTPELPALRDPLLQPYSPSK